ncbi:VanW family protein [bacterium]|nr:VanW family protein [bacterium]
MRKIVKIGISLAGITVTLIVAVFCFVYFPKDGFAYGIKIGGEDVGGLTAEKAEEKLEKVTERFYEEEIRFIFAEKGRLVKEKTKLKDLGINFDLKKSLEEPMKIGKGGSFFENLREKIFALQGRYNLPLKVKISEEKLDRFLTEKFGRFETLPKNAEIVFDEKTLNFKIEEGKEGMLFNREKIKKEIEKEAEMLKVNDIYLSLEKTKPEISKSQAESARERAQEILEAGPYLLLANNKKISIEKQKLGTWFSFLPQKEQEKTILWPQLDERLIESYLSELSETVNVEPKNPTLSFKEGKLEIVSPPKTGRVLKIKESAKEIQEKILRKETTITLLFEEKKPSITEEKIKELQIEKLIGTGTSNFAGSPKNRIHNIKIGASKFNGVLIAPDEEFSFNKTLGEVGPAQGYLPELVIKKNKTVPEYGGGICQVSTTMFRAAVNSGMKITARTPHAYPVKYYNPQGFDATVYDPYPDLRFINNTGGYILIQSKIEGNNLTFEFYGKDDKRKVIVKGPYQYDFKEDGSMKAKLYQEVWREGKLILKQTFLSSYKSPKLYPIQEE